MTTIFHRKKRKILAPEAIQAYWSAVLKQEAAAIYPFFTENAIIKWHNTNECFTVPEFVYANCAYPGDWDGEIEKLLLFEDQAITVTHVFSADKTLSLHVTSFMQLKEDKIIAIDEYWGDDGDAPKWRRDLKIGVLCQ